jgi:hypothetical protein
VLQRHRASRHAGTAVLLACLVPIALFPPVGAAQSQVPTGPTRFYRGPMPLQPPAIGPKCQSVPQPSPDNHCEAHYVQTRGEGWNAQTSAYIRCEWADGGMYADEIIRIFSADRPIHLRWIDATALEVGLPTDVGFSPPRDRVEHSGHSIRYVYRPVSSKDLGPLQCFDEAEDFRNWRDLHKPARPAGEAGWVTYGSKQTCLLAGNALPPRQEFPPIAIQFLKTATARLPFGTTKLVLSVLPRHSLPQAPRLVLSPEEPPLVLQPSGPTGRYRLVAAPAERLLSRLDEGGKAQLSVTLEQSGAQSFEVARDDFAAAHAAFSRCVAALRAP